jgi:hypothetical protein
MPEFVLDRTARDEQIPFDKLPEFVQGYIEALFFTNSGEPDDGIKPWSSYADLSAGAIERILEDCNSFFLADGVDVALGDADLRASGRDFWYTRNGHGCGFWDRACYRNRDHLTQIAQEFCEVDPYTGGDGFIYL